MYETRETPPPRGLVGIAMHALFGSFILVDCLVLACLVSSAQTCGNVFRGEVQKEIPFRINIIVSNASLNLRIRFSRSMRRCSLFRLRRRATPHRTTAEETEKHVS